MRDFFDEFVALPAECQSVGADERATGESGDGCEILVVTVGAEFRRFDYVRLDDIFIEGAERGLQSGPGGVDALCGGGRVVAEWLESPKRNVRGLAGARGILVAAGYDVGRQIVFSQIETIDDFVAVFFAACEFTSG